MIAATILLAGLVLGPPITTQNSTILNGTAPDGAAITQVAFDPQACGIPQADKSAAPPDDVNAMIRRLVDILDLAERREEEAALKQSAEAGLAVAAFRETRAIERIYEVSEQILSSYDDRQLHVVFAKALRAGMDPTAYPERITDTRRIRLLKTMLDRPLTLGSRSQIDTRLYLEYRLDTAKICESRKIFLNIAIADGDRFRSGGNADLYFEALEKRVNRLTGQDVTGLPLKWFAFSQLTKAVMRYGDFELAWRFLKRTEAEAEIARATMDLNETSLDDLNVVMAWLGPYFLQERMDHACPDEHYIGRVPCVLREHD